MYYINVAFNYLFFTKELFQVSIFSKYSMRQKQFDVPEIQPKQFEFNITMTT